jgi:hypothetical protein
MAKWARLILGCVQAAAVTAIGGGFVFFLGLVGWGIITGDSGTLGGSIGPTSPGVAYAGFLFWAMICAMLAFAPALCGAAGVLLPLHLLLERGGRAHAAWYAAAGGASAMLATVLLRHFFGYWSHIFLADEFDGMLAVAALGGPLGGLVYRQFVTL